MKLIFVSFTGQFDLQGDYMKNCCHFLNQFRCLFIFVCVFLLFVCRRCHFKMGLFFSMNQSQGIYLNECFTLWLECLLLITCLLSCSFLQALRARQKEAVLISSISDIIEQHVS